MPRAAAAILAAVAIGFAGCGGGGPETPEEAPAELLREAAANPVESGEAEIEIDAELEGESLLAGPSDATLAGPFDTGAGVLPRFELEGEAELGGFGVEGALISTGEDAFVDFFGELYRVGEPRVAAIGRRLESAGNLGLGVTDWIEDPRYGEIEEVGGADAQRIEGSLSVDAVAADLGPLVDAIGVPILSSALTEGVRSGAAEIWIALDDRTVRRVRVGIPFTVPRELLAASRGITGGTIDLDAEVSDVGAEVSIDPPAGGGFKPIESLIEELRGLARLGGL